MNIRSYFAEMNNNDELQVHFYVPTLQLLQDFGKEGFTDKDMTTFYDKDTGKEIITVPCDIDERYTWDAFERYFRKYKMSQHSPVYRIIKAIFDGNLHAKKDDADEYGVKYECVYIIGYEILQQKYAEQT